MVSPALIRSKLEQGSAGKFQLLPFILMRAFLSLLILTLFWAEAVSAQRLKLKPRNSKALTGSEFASSISDTSISQAEREQLILEQLKAGNVPEFLRTFVKITDTARIDGKRVEIAYWVAPDYIAIGSNSDYFYCPMTPMLAQRIARLTGCSLPTAKMVDKIYAESAIKLVPLPIPPSRAMVTVPVFIEHSTMIHRQRETKLLNSNQLIAGHKKDIVISKKIYDTGEPRVVIYGWHKSNDKPIQPLYNGHSPQWVDYSHGVRLISSEGRVNGKKIKLQSVLKSPDLHVILSEEGVISQPYYPEIIISHSNP